MVTIDRLDRRILEELQKNGSISNLELAELVGLSPSPCSRRVKQLEESGIINRTVTLLNPEKLNLKLTAIIQVSMDRHTPDRFENFEQTLEGYPEVMACSLITGQAADYLIEVLVQDMDGYQAFLLGRLTRIPGVTGVHSSFVLRKIIDRTEIPLTHLK
ncbi:Lrp/AsnC family transcriptional regulator [Alkalimarinus sediminis]|uniref:Lrp/AsnC family transcriptional regulator n=1 Tax=Alkalimarinus sediminis TaxID=1632866 RepID=A0A9E8HLN7_9ALTE|nr:Lrp/AsnC family transcriptional regulator [Alkalimarinus sediminis]UZW75151.1 Lrp/AsnC family transcriptional regulator [Alkalimarinus sediminis]